MDNTGDGLNETIVVVLSVVFNTTVELYFFDLEINIYWLNTTGNTFELAYEEYDLLNSTVQENEVFSIVYEYPF